MWQMLISWPRPYREGALYIFELIVEPELWGLQCGIHADVVSSVTCQTSADDSNALQERTSS